jgi:type II secretory pathway pseudopilin PulG
MAALIFRHKKECFPECPMEPSHLPSPPIPLIYGNAGFSYMGVLLLTAIMGIAIASANHTWRTMVKRELEAELLFRGDQIRRAIKSYHQASGDSSSPTYPLSLNDLLKDPRFPGAIRHLRKVYSDPFTGKRDWVVLRDGSGRIKGVYSSHPGKPLKRVNFEDPYGFFSKAKTYQDWQFVHVPQSQAADTSN